MAIQKTPGMSSRKKRKEPRHRIQAWWRLKRWCRAEGVGVPARRAFDSSILGKVRSGDLGLDAFAYYLYRICENQHIRKWAKVEQQELGISTETLKRLRRSLRDNGLMTTVNLGTSTYCVHHTTPLEEGKRKSVFSLLTQALKKEWLASSGREAHPRALVSAALAAASNSGFDRRYILRRPLLFALCQLDPDNRGTERLKAVGLWVLLLKMFPETHNWETPEKISRLTGVVSPNTSRKLCRTLQRLGLLYFDKDSREAAVSLFPLGRWEGMHPLNNERFNTTWPWYLFRHQDPGETLTVLPKNRPLKPLPANTVRPPLGYSRQPCCATEETRKGWERLAKEMEAEARRQAGLYVEWRKNDAAEDKGKGEEEQAVDLQAYCNGEDW